MIDQKQNINPTPKWRIWLLLTISIVCILFYIIKSPNTEVIINSPLLFSHQSGVYSKSLKIQIHDSLNSENLDIQIYFTTDGSEPTTNSILYKDVIDTDNYSNCIISNIPTTQSPGKDKKWKKPTESDCKSIVIKARAFIDEKPIGTIFTNSYIIRFQNNLTLPVLSISTDKDNLFDNSKGILVPGNLYTSGMTGNYMERGKEWERRIHLEWFDSSGKLAFEQDAGMRIHGGTSRQFPLKGLRLYAREEYGKSNFEYKIFNNKSLNSYTRFLLRPSGHDFYLCFFRDAMIQSFAENSGLEYSACQPVILYINGEYWGITNVRERFDRYFIEQSTTISNAYICDGDAVAFVSDMKTIEALDCSKKEDFDKLKELIDIENYTDYKIFESFFSRWDMGNIKPWRAKQDSGQWRFILSDFDVAMGGFWSTEKPWEFNFFDYFLEEKGAWNHLLGHNQNQHKNTMLLRKLLESEDYRNYFLSRYSYFLDTVFTEENLLARIETYSSQIQYEIPNHIKRWNYPENLEAWESNIDDMREFARKRTEIVRGQLFVLM